ncbi:MAG: purine-binding chemotaxis protein CheW [Phycisphaerales bacterium]|nr:purine-binding chemotaxis protein CheW [Phycisphaerales bacterium]
MQSTPSTKAASGNQEELLQLVTFKVGDEQFGVDILNVQEINRMMDLTQVPQSPPGVEGIINLRGRIIPVMSLRKRFGLTDVENSEQTRIVVVDVSGHTIGFIVDSVQEVLRIGSSTIEKTPPVSSGIDATYISGIARLENTLLILLDLHNLLPTETLNQVANLNQAA